MKTVIWLFVILLFVILFFACSQNSSPSKIEEPDNRTQCEIAFDELCKKNPIGFKSVETMLCKVEGYCDPEPPKPPGSK